MKKLMSTVVLSVLSACLIPNIALAQQDGEYVQIVKVAPKYPASAAAEGLEGHVVVEFTITEEGTVEESTVTESTNAVFDEAAVQAVNKFKYKPRILNGGPVAVPGVHERVLFRLP